MECNENYVEKNSTYKYSITRNMTFLADWYTNNSENGIGFSQIGGGHSRNFPNRCGANVISRYGAYKYTFLELLLSNK
jgi:hypothetical protein